MNKNNKMVHGIKDFEDMNSDSRSIISMTYVCTAFSLGITFFIWYFINAMKWLPIASQIAGPALLASMFVVLFARVDFSSSFPAIIAYYTILTFGMGLSAAVSTELVLLEQGSYVVLTAIAGTVVTFLVCAILGHYTTMDFMARGQIAMALCVFSISISFLSFIIIFLFPQSYSAIDLIVTYLSVPITMFYIFFMSSMIRDLANSAISSHAEEDGKSSKLNTQLRNAKIALICSISMFMNIISLFLRLLRILSRGNR